MNNFIKLGDLCLKITDGSHYSPKSIENGYPMLSVKDMEYFGFNYDNCNHISEEEFIKMQKNDCVPKINDILISKDGSYLKEIFVVKHQKREAILSSIGILRPNLNLVIPEYIKYYLSTDFIKKQVGNNYVSGSALPRIILKQFSNIEVLYRNINEQEKIVKILKTIDRKIELNNKINSTLESLAKTLYGYYFLQFDFPDKNGKPYKSSGGKMVYNNILKKEIPEGWEVGNLYESNKLFKLVEVGINEFDGYKMYLPTGNVINEELTNGDLISFNNRENRANMQPDINTVWFAKMKNSVKHITIPDCGKWFVEKYILSTGFEGLKCSKTSLAFIHCLINSSYFEMHKDILSHGATQQSINDIDLKNIKYAIPDDETLLLFNKTVYPILETKFNNIKENKELSELRDFLLPLLMNGQVKIEDEK